MNPTRTNDDPLSIRYELAAALAGYDAGPSPAAAFAVAAALGKARLFGVLQPHQRLTSYDADCDSRVRRSSRSSAGFVERRRTRS